MLRLLLVTFLLASPALLASDSYAPERSPLLQKSWYELKTENFRVFSCAPTQAVAKLTASLEQFRAAYSSLAGTQAVAAPPLIVMVYPDQPSMAPYTQLYEGKPSNVSAFFMRGSDENWIVTSLSDVSQRSLNSIYHEYAHLLLRRNDRVWPLWLKEGMADLYSTFQLVGLRGRIALHKTDYVLLLRREGLMSLQELMEVNTKSPTYSDKHLQGRFYAQSWLLTHYLVAGDNAVLRSRFPSFTTRLRDGEEPLEALTKALGVTPAALENALQSYLMRPALHNIEFSLKQEVRPPNAASARPVSQAEAAIRLGNQLMRVHQFDKAQQYVEFARKLAPTNAMPYESLGLLASARDQSGTALHHLQRAIELKSTSFLAHYLYGREKLRVGSRAEQGYKKVDPKTASIIRGALGRSTEIMPSFGPAHHLLGLLEIIQGESPAKAEQHVRKALELEPENATFSMTLARIQIARADKKGARETLRSLLHPAVDEKMRDTARAMLQKLG